MSKQNRTLLVLQYIWEHSDEDHQVTAKDIITFLEKQGVSATSRTVKADVDQLIDFGIDIEVVHSTQNRFYMYERKFELAEVKLLIDAVQSARFITDNKSKKIIKKLSAFASEHQKDELKRQLYVEKRIKTGNDSGYYSVDSIHTAIQKKKKVSFKYLEIAPDKSKREKHNGQIYVFSPYAMVWNNDCYYAIGYSEAPNHNKVVKFRVDRMKGINILDSSSVRKPKDFDVKDYFSQIFLMYDGPECIVELICENSLMKNIVDQFGEDVATTKVDKDRFHAKVEVCLSPTFYSWVFAYGGEMRILGPKEAIEGFEKMLRKFDK